MSYKNSYRPNGGDAFRLGSAFDDLMYFPDTWHDKYHVMEAEIPTGNMAKLCERYIELLKKGSWDSHEKMFAEAYDHSGYEISKESVEGRFKKKGLEYCEEQAEHSEKIGISLEEAQMLEAMKRSLLSEETTAKYFQSAKNVDLHVQLPVYWNEDIMVDGKKVVMPCKILLDSVVVDHNRKVIYPADLKTTGDSAYKFAKSYMHFKYYLQAAMYYDGMIQWRAQQGLDHYHIEEFRFIVCEKRLNPRTVLYKVSKEDIKAGSSGFTSKGKFIRGWRRLLIDLAWHQERDLWDHPRSIYEDGEVILNELH